VLSGLGLPGALELAVGADGKSAARASLKDIRQQARIRVDEKGTEASAVTSVSVGVVGVTPKALSFQAKHPFLFLVRDRSTNAVLFLGRVVSPAPETKGR
jgi:serpin B